MLLQPNNEKKQFSSISAEVRYYTKEVLEDMKPHSAAELRETVEKMCKDPGKCTRGVFSGVFRDLVVNGKGAYLLPERGVYQKAPERKQKVESKLVAATDSELGEAKQSFALQAVSALDKAAWELESGCTFNMLKISDEDILIARQLQKLLDDIYALKKKLDHK